MAQEIPIATAQELFDRFQGYTHAFGRFDLKPPKKRPMVMLKAIKPDREKAKEIYAFYEAGKKDTPYFTFFKTHKAVMIQFMLLERVYMIEASLDSGEIVGYLMLINEPMKQIKDPSKTCEVIWPFVQKARWRQTISTYMFLAAFQYAKDTLGKEYAIGEVMPKIEGFSTTATLATLLVLGQQQGKPEGWVEYEKARFIYIDKIFGETFGVDPVTEGKLIIYRVPLCH